MKVLIVGFGLAGIYAASALQDHELEIISADIGLDGQIGFGRVEQWGGVLYHFADVYCYSRKMFQFCNIGSRNINIIGSRLNVNIAQNKGVLFKGREAWFKKSAFSLMSRAKFSYGVLKYVNSEKLIFSDYSIKINNYDKIFILIDHINLLKILQESKILDDEVFFGDHFSKVVYLKDTYDTHFLHAGKLQIKRQPFLGIRGNLEYYHSIPMIYNPRFEEFINLIIARNVIGALILAISSLHQKWVWWALISAIFVIKLRNLVQKSDVVTKHDRDIRPRDRLLKIKSGQIYSASALDDYQSISHEYGIDDMNHEKLLAFCSRVPNLSFNPSVFLRSLGPANVTLPILQLLEDELRDVNV
ncbi:hypothetical protein [Roseobacter sp. HKCCD5988]|uniref:hypothetical protein n=1 Tax=Roseobacter sp. HKCCD5988 TaxID=3120338 RepID=UPI0030EC571E